MINTGTSYSFLARRIYFLLLALLTFPFLSYSQVGGGICRTVEEYDNSGTTVILTDINSGVSDSVVTNSIGGYVLQGPSFTGPASITYKRPGFQPRTINFNKTVSYTNFPLYYYHRSKPTAELNPIESGILHSDTAYVTQSKVEVPLGKTLTIQKGTEMYFDTVGSFEWNGSVNCQGTAAEPVKFGLLLAYPTQRWWSGIDLGSNSLDYAIIIRGSVLMNDSNGSINHCEFDSSTVKLNRERSEILNSSFKHNRLQPAVSVTFPSDTALISNCTFDGYGLGIESWGSGNDINLHIKDCKFKNFSYGVRLDKPAIVEGCEFSYCNEGVRNGQGIITYNVFHHNTLGIRFGGDEYPQVINNTFAFNVDGAYYYVTNDIIWNSNIFAFNTGIGLRDPTDRTDLGRFTCHFNDDNFAALPAQTYYPISGVNMNGDSIDQEYNIYQDPLFYSVDSTSPFYLYLDSLSPCVNAGDTGKVDSDGSIRDMGALPAYTGFVGVPDQDKTELSFNLFPNPSNGEFTILSSSLINTEFRLLDLNGKVILSGSHRGLASRHSIPDNIKSGLYLLMIETPNGIETRRMIVNRY